MPSIGCGWKSGQVVCEVDNINLEVLFRELLATSFPCRLAVQRRRSFLVKAVFPACGMLLARIKGEVGM
jgi:hypothetical protein